ncbi:MAG TPA: DUF6485 family protein [Candidatus Moranbacteria bacterium]|jgi:hypothetical protein|nr:hypothetical protein [Candidatus Moranbacteria bacterium]HOF42725.1 DUF6485 family protein [Candidatus Moranbacteria bacterium]HPX94216.1 DUF6485 family protein [Candidatus Moranbacteria bacterium]HQB59695.1 DUF6485 family protein [Candidatus Moranbacteria bacterium]
MQCKKEQNRENCPCSYPDCPRKGICCECVAYHRIKGQIPACFFPVEAEMATMNDRSIENFIKAYGEYKEQLKKLPK